VQISVKLSIFAEGINRGIHRPAGKEPCFLRAQVNPRWWEFLPFSAGARAETPQH